MFKNIIKSLPEILVFVLDRMSKVYILKHLYLDKKDIFSFLSFTYIENTGVAFGAFKNLNIFFIFLNSFLLILLLFYKRKINDKISILGIRLIIGGALGNIYDRIVYGYVIDFIDFHFFPAVFNIADSFITIGAIIIATEMFINDIKLKKINKIKEVK